jgi:hypothetical protein
MGDGEEQAAAAPTEVASAADAETQSVHASALSDYDGEGLAKQPRTFTLGQIVTTVAVVLCLGVMLGVAAFIGYHLRDNDGSQRDSAVASSSTTPSLVQATVPPAAPQPPTPTVVPPLPATTTVTVRQPAPPSAHLGTFTTYVLWRGAPCVEIHIPDGGALDDRAACDASQTAVIHHTGRTGELIGADPVMNDATAIGCKVVSDATGAVLTTDNGTAGDGHDINCIITAP